MASAADAPDSGGVQPIRSTDSAAHRAFALLAGGLILLCVLALVGYAATAGA
jgi:hypothetical protein